jgi:transcriptional regulator with XRE-family HTH domain
MAWFLSGLPRYLPHWGAVYVSDETEGMSPETGPQGFSVSRDAIGVRVGEAREVTGLSLEAMSRRLAELPENERPQYHSPKQINRWERGEASVPAEYLAFLSQQTGRPVDLILFGPGGVMLEGEVKSPAERKLQAIRAILEAKSAEDVDGLLRTLRAVRDGQDGVA